MSVNLQGHVFNGAGEAVEGATIEVFTVATGATNTTATASATTSTNTDSTGLWTLSAVAEGTYDIRIKYGTEIRWLRHEDKISLTELDVRNGTGEATPAATFSNIANGDDMEIVHFRGLRGTGVADDNMFFRYYMNDDGGNITEVARMTVNLVDAGASTEDAKIVWSIRSAGSGTLVDALTIASSASAAQSIDFNQDSITFGTGTAATDITLTFDAETNDGVITWMEDEDYFKFSDDILMNTTERINFHDTAIYIYASTDGQLDLVADTEIQIAATTIDINGAVALNGAITGATNITLSGELDAATLDLSSSADIAGDLVLSGGADGALQFSNAGENSIKIPDNQASALIIEEDDNAYITFVTTDSSEAITVAKATSFSAGIANAGTIAAGTWNGTDVGVAYGGTGASSLTDGGVLLGSGTGAITAMSVLSDSQMIVGNGSTDPVAESGATLRTSIGVGTGDAVEFAGITGTTIDATTDFTIGATIITNGVITDSSGLQLAAAVDLNGNTLSNVGDSGNDWTANQLIMSSALSGNPNQIYLRNTSTDMNSKANIFVSVDETDTAGVDPVIDLNISGAVSWTLGVDNSQSNRFTIGTGTSGTNDRMRIVTGGAVTFDDSTGVSGSDFTPDYVCDGCGQTGLEMFACCGVVTWHDDVLALREMKLSQSGIDQMVKLGVYEIDGPDDADPGWVGINFQKAQHITWAGMWQNRERMDAQYDELNKRLQAIGA